MRLRLSIAPQGVMCICYAQMLSALLMFVLITLLVMVTLFTDTAFSPMPCPSPCPILVVAPFPLKTACAQAFIDEEEFLRTHYYTASKRLFMASMM